MNTLLSRVAVFCAFASASVAQPGPRGVDRLFAGPGDTAYAISDTLVYRTDDAGRSWERSGALPQVPRGVLYPSVPGPVVTLGGGIIIWGRMSRFNTFWYNDRAKSDDGGQTWDTSFGPGGPSDLFAASVEGGFVVSVSGDGMNTDYGVTRSVDNDQTWEPVAGPDEGGTLRVSNVSAIAARGDRAALFVSWMFFERCPDGPNGPGGPCAGVARSEDRGETWTTTRTTGTDFPGRLALGPDGSLYGWVGETGQAGNYSRLYRLPPSDSVWVPLPLPSPTTVILAFDVADDGSLFVGTRDGVSVSRDLGASWTSDNLSGRITALERTQAGTLLALAGRSVWRRTGDRAWDQGQASVGTDDSDLPTLTLRVTARPNPTVDRLTIEAVGTEDSVALEVFDVVGRTVFEGRLDLATGRVRFDLEVSSWSPGVYVIRATDSRSSAVSRVTVAR